MSKKKQQKGGGKSSSSRAKRTGVKTNAKTSVKKKSDLLKRNPVTSPQDDLYKKIFKWSALAMLLLVMLLSLGSGVNGDDEFQNDYSRKLVNYYTSMGADSSALHIEKGNMHYYGGFFDLVTGLVNTSLGLDDYDPAYHHIRHLFNAMFGFLTLLFVGLIAKEIAGWRAGILAMILLFLSPRFLGHSLMNPKDIPFAAGFAVAMYYMILLFRKLPNPGWKVPLGLALGIALAIATRAGGLLLIAYFGLFAGLDFIFKHGFKGIIGQGKLVLTYAGYVIGISLVGYILALLTWPFALADPLNHPLEALTEFSKLGVRIRCLFMGDNMMSDDTPWFYSMIWIAKTIPLFTLIGLIGSLFFLPQIWKRYQVLPVLLMYFATVFPVFYVIYKDSLLHDAWRHLTFVYPSMVVIVSLFWIRVEELFKDKKTILYALWGILAITALDPALFIVRNIHYPYVYFNPIGGGLGGAYGNYETDYWGVGIKQAINWMEKEGIVSEDMQDTVVIGTNFYYNVGRQSYRRFNGKVITKYVRFNQRYSQDWDYGIFPSRFVRGPHLRSGNWPESKTVHTIKANGTPVVAILRNDDDFAYLGGQAVKNRDWTTAVTELGKEVQKYPDNELAWLGLVNAYLNQGQFPKAVEAADKALVIAPENENAFYLKGLSLLQSGDPTQAMRNFQQAVEVNDDYSLAYYYMGVIYQNSNDLSNALKSALRVIQINPRFKAAYELAAAVYQQQGDNTNAARYREAANRL